MNKDSAIKTLHNLEKEAREMPARKGKSELIRKITGSIEHLDRYNTTEKNVDLFVRSCTAEFESVFG